MSDSSDVQCWCMVFAGMKTKSHRPSVISVPSDAIMQIPNIFYAYWSWVWSLYGLLTTARASNKVSNT